MKFRKYQKLERFGRTGVGGIESGECYVFSKIDGTNASVWKQSDGTLGAGSRNRELSYDADNAGFFKYVQNNDALHKFFEKYPGLRLYGEFLVPHTIKHYQEDAWREFYVFDVVEELEDDKINYLHYEEYKELLEEFGIPFIPPIAIINNGSYENFIKALDDANFLVEDGKHGEGIVIKNYDYVNCFGEVRWAKIVSNEFKQENHKVFGAPVVNSTIIEYEIVDKFLTIAFIEKEAAKIMQLNEEVTWSGKLIPIFLKHIWKEFLEEEMYEIVLDFKEPTINFKTMHKYFVRRLKVLAPELF